MELFEALKMRIRHQLGFPLVAKEDEASRPDEVERQLEVGLLDACREAGTMLIEDGKVGEGWMYLRPTGDQRVGEKIDRQRRDQRRQLRRNDSSVVARRSRRPPRLPSDSGSSGHL